MIRRRAPFLAALLGSVAALASAGALAGAVLPSAATAQESLPRPGAVPPTLVESVSPTGYRVRVPIGEAQVSRGRVFGFDLAEIEIPGGSVQTAWGDPALPTRVVLLRVPWGASPDVRGARRGSRSLGTLEPTPIPHLVREEFARRRSSPRALAEALSGPAYRPLAGAGEAPAVARATPMASAGERVLAVTLAPVTWDPATREARIAEEIVLDVSWDRPETPLTPGAVTAPGAPFSQRSPRVPGPPASTFAADAAGPRYAPRARSGLAAPRRLAARAAVGPMRVDTTRAWVRLLVPRGGLYRVTPADLAAAGVTPGAIDPATFRLFRANPGDLPESLDVDTGPDSLRECAIEVTGSGDGVFGGGDVLYFDASGETGFGYDLRRGGGTEYEETQRTDQEPLWLTWGAGLGPAPPRRMATRDATPVTAAAPLYTAVTHRVHIEENQTAAFDLFQSPLRWERWFMSLLQTVQATTRRRFPTALPGALPGGAMSLRVRMWGSSITAEGPPDHVARIYWNGVLAGSAGFNHFLPQDIVVSGLRTNGALDSLEIEIPYRGRVDVQYLAWYEAVYPRALAAVNDTLRFAAPDSVAAGRVRYAIGGITDTTAAWLLDRTDPEAPARLVGGAWSGAASPFTLTVEDSAGPGYRPRYSLVSIARAPTPALSLYAPPAGPGVLADLLDPANAADYLIVAPPNFLAAAQSLAVERSTRLPGVASPRAVIATTDRIYAQLAGGRPDPVAIRNLLVYASRHWSAAPLYLCLLGDASEDPKNYTRFATPDWVPTYGEYWDPTIRAQFVSDDFFAFLDGPGDQLFDLAVGRLPAHDPADAALLTGGKRATFDRTADFDWWRTRVLLTADDAWKWSIPGTMRDPVGIDHVRQMERKDAFHIPFAVRREKVYLNDYPFADSTKTSKPKARDAFIAAVNAGNWMVDYIGHGSEDLLADEQVLRSSDVSRLTNASRPSIFGFFSCTVGRFDENGREGLAELLLRLPGGGAAVSLAASREVFGFSSTLLNDAFVDNLFPLTLPSGAPRVDTLRTAGLAWALAKNAPFNLNQVVRKYAFLGEPAVTPPLPRGRGEWEKGPLDSIPRGEVLVVRGHALNADDATRDTISSGTVLLEVLGPPSPRVQLSTLNGVNVPTTYYLPGPVLYRGETTLDSGAFTLRFVVPTDGRVIGRGTQLRALLSSAGGEGVGLAADSLIIAAALSPRVDQTPPTIRLRPAAGGDSSYAPGAVLTFEIEDSSGIDLTRFDNAHGIFVIVDDRGTPIDLTPTFRYEPSSYTRGTATLTLPQLSGGAHLLEVHASDAYRNVGVATFIIDVSEGAGPNAALTMTEVFNYPNPFPRDTYLHARLNRAARLRVQILTVSGRRVRDFTVEGRSGENYIPWDGRDSEGEKVALGVYLVKLTAEAPGGNRVTAVARALRAE